MTSTTRTFVDGGAETSAGRRTLDRIANLQANVRLVANDLPDPTAAGFLLLIFDQCRTYELTHEQLVEVFGRPLLAFLDLALQAIEKLCRRSGLSGESGEPDARSEDPDGEPARRQGLTLTPYQLVRLRDIVAEYASAMADARAIEALLLLYDVLETFELSPGQMETVFGTEALHTVTSLVYGERGQTAPHAAGEATQYDLPAEAPSIRVGGRPVPFFGTVGENGHVTYTPEARLWLRYIGRPQGGAGGAGGASGDAA